MGGASEEFGRLISFFLFFFFFKLLSSGYDERVTEGRGHALLTYVCRFRSFSFFFFFSDIFHGIYIQQRKMFGGTPEIEREKERKRERERESERKRGERVGYYVL